MKNLIILIFCLLSINAIGQKKRKTTTTTTTSTSSVDTLWKYCGMIPNDSGWVFQSVTLTNLKTYHRTAQIKNPDGSISNSDVSVIAFDPAVIPGKTINGYKLLANNCDGRVGCAYINGLKCAQVTTQIPYPQFELLLGLSWLSTANYTGMIIIETNDYCLYASQPFQFTPPQIQ